MKKEEIEQRLVENKQERKQLKQQLKDLPCLEVGWYKSNLFDNWLAYFDGISYVYGFRPLAGKWFNEKLGCIPSELDVPATDKEVEEALIKEAKKRGFKGDFEFSVRYNELGLGCNWIFREGKWAEIIQTKTVELNGNYTEVQLKDILNSQF